MANKQATLIIKLKDMASKGMKGLGKIFDKFVFTAGDVVNGIRSMVSAAKEMVEISAQAKTVKTAFENLAAAQGQDAQKMLANMRDLSKGTIADLELMKQANQALLLGLPVDRFGDMLTIARSSAQATGQSMDFMLNSIVTGLGRGSKLMLDNLGIMIDTQKAYENYAATLGTTADKLDDNQKKQAFINEALRIGTENAKNAGDAQLTVGDRLAQMAAQAENAKVALAESLGPAMEITLRSAQRFISIFTGFLTGNTAARWAGEFALALENLVLGFEALGKTIGIGVAGAWESLSAAMKGNFSQAKEIASMAMQEISEAQQLADEQAIANRESFNERMSEIENKNEADRQKRLQKKFQDEQLMKQKLLGLETKEVADKKKTEQQKIDVEKKAADARASNMAQTSSLLQSHLGKDNAITKAAGLANISMQTPVAIGKAMASAPPPLNYILAAGVGAAMAKQAAQLAGVQLADGGIVMPSNGGTRATIGEGGRAEAVIPLPDDFDPDRGGLGGSTNVNISFNGPMLGDENTAREFARAIDEELLRLRQRNESVAFDSGVF